MTITLPAVPALESVFETLVTLVETNPTRVAKHSYLTPKGEPHCIVAFTYVALGGPIRNLANLQSTTGNGDKRLSSVWSSIYDSSAMFLDLQASETVAQDFLVYALLGDIQHAQDHGQSADSGWADAWRRALLKFRRFLVSPTWGFLVQTRGAHEDLRDYALKMTDTALERTK